MGLRLSNTAVTEVLSTVLLLVIATVFFASMSYLTLGSINSYFEDPEPIVTIVGFVSNDTIILEHRGGHSLYVETTEVTFSVENNVVEQGKIKDFIEPAGSTYWTISQQITYTNNSGEDLSGKRITALVVDKNSGTILFDGVIRTGFEGATPIVETLPASDFTTSSFQLNMQYTLYDSTTYNYVWFEYREQGESDWIETSHKFLSFGSSGYYSKTVENLQLYYNTYQFRACIGYTHSQHGDQITYGETLSFSMFDRVVGRWNFNEQAGNTAFDNSGYDNDGKIFGPTLGVNGIDESAFKFSHHTDKVIVENSNILQISKDLTLSTWIRPDKDEHSYFAGQFVEQKNDLSQDDFIEPSVVHIHYNFGEKEHVYAVAYRTNNNKGYVKTVCISDDGDIQDEIGDRFVFDGVVEPVIVKVFKDVYAIVWNADNGQQLVVTTVSISETGEVITVLDTELFEVGGLGEKPVVKKIGSRLDYQFFLVSSSGFEVGGSLRIMKISDEGDKIDIVYTAAVYDLEGCLGTDIINVGSDVFAVVYAAEDQEGGGGFSDDLDLGFGGPIVQNPSTMVIRTYRIPASFDNILFIKEKLFDITIASRPSIAKNTDESEVYVVAFAGLSQGALYAVKLNSYGKISDDIYEYQIAYSFDSAPRLYYVSDSALPSSLYLLSGSVNGRGVVFSIYLEGLDTTTAYVCDISFFDYKGFTSDIIYIHKMAPISLPPRYLIVYGGNSFDTSEGFFGSIRVHPLLKTKHLLVKDGSYELHSTDSRVFAYLNGEQILFADITTEQWNFVVLTYDFSSGWAQLYVNGAWQSSYHFNEVIHQNNNAVRLGGVYGVMDEVAIYMQALSSNEINSMYNALKP